MTDEKIIDRGCAFANNSRLCTGCVVCDFALDVGQEWFCSDGCLGRYMSTVGGEVELVRESLATALAERDAARTEVERLQGVWDRSHNVEEWNALRTEVARLRDLVPPERFPIIDGPSVPWSLVAPHEAQARANHDQSLRRLAKRGGLSPGELWCVVHSKRWSEAPDDATALAWLRSWAGIGVEGMCDQLRAEVARLGDQAAHYEASRDVWMERADALSAEVARLKTEMEAMRAYVDHRYYCSSRSHNSASLTDAHYACDCGLDVYRRTRPSGEGERR